MDKCRINIAVIEPSQIVYEGLAALLMKSKNHYYIFHLKDLEELRIASDRTKFNIAILNPTVIQNKTNDFLKLKKQFSEISWIGLIYSFYDDKLLSVFNEIFSITDDNDIVLQKINNTHNQCYCKECSNGNLSQREIEVLTCLAKGLANKEIADKLNISIHTVISHRKNLVEKTGIKSLSGLTIYAISKKIIPLENSPY